MAWWAGECWDPLLEVAIISKFIVWSAERFAARSSSEDFQEPSVYPPKEGR